MVAYQKYILSVALQVTQIFRTVCSDFFKHGFFVKWSRRLWPLLGADISINFGANEEKLLVNQAYFLCQLKSLSRNRVSVNMRKAWYLSIRTWSQYVSIGKSLVPIPGKSQNLILRLSGWSYGFGSLLHSVTPTLAAFSSKSLRLKKKKKTKKSKKTSAWNYLCNLSHCIALTSVKGAVA